MREMQSMSQKQWRMAWLVVCVGVLLTAALVTVGRANATPHRDFVCHKDMGNGGGNDHDTYKLVPMTPGHQRHLDEGRDVLPVNGTCPGSQTPEPTPTVTVTPTPTEEPTEEPTETPTVTETPTSEPPSTRSPNLPPMPTRTPTRQPVPQVNVESRTKYQFGCTEDRVLSQHQTLGGAWVTDAIEVVKHENSCRRTTVNPHGEPTVVEEGF